MLNYEQFSNPISTQNPSTHTYAHTHRVNFKAMEIRFVWLGLFLNLKLHCIPHSTFHCVIHKDFVYLKLESNLML